MQNTHAQCGCRACERAREWARVHAEQATPDLAVALARAGRLFQAEVDALRARLAEVERERDSAAAVLRDEMRLRAAAELDRDRHAATLETVARLYMKCVVCLRARGEAKHATIWANAGGPEGFPVCVQCWGAADAPRGTPMRPARVGDVIVNRASGTAERIARLDMGPRDVIDAYTVPPDFEGDPLAGTPEEVADRLGPPIRGARWWDHWKHADGTAISVPDLRPAPASG